MLFIIGGLKYDTDKMEKVSCVKKYYEINSGLLRLAFDDMNFGRTYDCILWRSKNGRWLLTHEVDYGVSRGEVLEEDEVKELLMRHDLDKYEELFGEVPEA